ncbi:MAG: GntR family transcriptional regulator / MocR family aminotransferase [Erysipelotrichaceae bacterium]|nr:MAG: GntR family transcriptional regulator / MocR family aminotransferase [Erysipelotrichaceae bacterium]
MVLPPKLMQKYLQNLSFMLCSVPLIEQKVLYRFINDGFFERHLNKMRTLYRKKYDVLVQSVTEMNSNIEILGADAGLHILIKITNGMTERELVQKAFDRGIEVHGISRYFFESVPRSEYPIILLGYASMNEFEIKKAVSMLREAWLMDDDF